MKWFWADLHLNHAALLEHRPGYRDVFEMNEDLVFRWNKYVGPRDEAWVLGDFGFKHGLLGTPLPDLFALLNGRKHLIVGNHDEKNPAVLKLGWESVEKFSVVKDDGMSAFLCHYPVESWPSMHHGRIHLHGHSHGSLRTRLPRRFDVGADATPHPRNLPEMWALGHAEDFVPVDHHRERKERAE